MDANMSKTPPKVADKPLRPLSWEDASHPERKEWSTELLAAVREKLSDLQHANDIAKFWPGYQVASDNERIQFWAELIVAMAHFESGWNPHETYQEPPPPKGPGTLSVGLLQLSKGDGKAYGVPEIDTDIELKEPKLNLRLGVYVLARLCFRDGCIQNAANRGGARYWSVLRDGHHPQDIAKRVQAALK